MSLTHLAAQTSVDAVVEVIRRDGAVIVDHLAPDELLAEMSEELGASFAETELCVDEFNGLNTRRTGGLIARSEDGAPADSASTGARRHS